MEFGVSTNLYYIYQRELGNGKGMGVPVLRGVSSSRHAATSSSTSCPSARLISTS